MVGSLLSQVTSAPAAQFWWTIALTFGGVMICAWQALRQVGHKRLMEDTPTSLIRSAAQGYVELQGHAALIEGDPIVAALSGEQCVWFRFCVERKERTTDRRGQTQTRWRTVERGVSEHLFALVDSTGTCVVDPDGARVTASVDHHWYGHSPQPPRITQAAEWTRWLGLAGLGRSYRYTEERITIGSPLYALGMFHSHAGMTPGPNTTDVAALLREWKGDQPTLKQRFDTNQDGEIDVVEWAAARQAAERELANAAPRGNLPPAVDTLVDTRDAQRPFLLSATSETALSARASRYALTFGLLSFAGAALALSCIAVRLAIA